jgi:DNA-binding SARP family transcriptional activator
VNFQPHSQATDQSSASAASEGGGPSGFASSFPTGRWQLYLTGEVSAVSLWGGAAQDELHGPQGRTVLAVLALADGPVSADELAERLWDGRRPRAWEGGLRVVVHRLRQALQPVLRSADPVPFRDGCYRLETDHAWIDARAAKALLVHAEREESSGDGRAAGLAHASACIIRRPFLPGVDGHWASRERRRLADLRGRALRCLAGSWLESGNESAAVGVAREAFELDRMSTRAALTLVQAQLSQGEHAHAMRSLEEHRAAVRSLGVGLSPELAALRRRIQARSRGSNVAPTAG